MHTCTDTEALYRPYGPRGGRGIALLFLDHGTRRGWGVRVTPRPLFTPGKYPVPIVQEAGWAPWPVWTGAENLAPTGIRSPDRPARSQLLYQLSYLAHCLLQTVTKLLQCDMFKSDFNRQFIGRSENKTYIVSNSWQNDSSVTGNFCYLFPVAPST